MNKDIGNKTQIQANSIHSNGSPHKCGYCKGKKPGGFDSWGLHSEKTRVDDYENMMHKGWRRCGRYYYKTDLKGSCCQLYTIRLKASEYKISDKQRKALNKFNRFLNGELDHKLTGEKPKEKVVIEEKKESMLEKYERILEEIVLNAVKESISKGPELSKSFDELKGKIVTKKTKNPSHGDISTNAALVLFNAVKNKGTVSLIDLQKAIIENVTLTDFKASPSEGGFINFKANFELKSLPQKENPKKVPFQHKISKEEAKSPAQQYTAYFKEHMPNSNPNPAHKYTVEIVPAMTTKETFGIYQRYQEHIHGEPNKNISSFTNFLCNSPLYDPNNPEDSKQSVPISDAHRVFKDQGVWPKYLGSYHMYHRIDGVLVAFGVIDFTPAELSSVYFLYDPKYKFLNWGVLGAIREIEYVQKIQESHCPKFEYYCMGYYIQDCIKSVYKGEYEPSYLLCPETYTWVPLSIAREKIAKSGYTRLAEPEVKLISDMVFSPDDMKRIISTYVILAEDDVIPFGSVIERFKVILKTIIAKLGKEILDNLIWAID